MNDPEPTKNQRFVKNLMWMVNSGDEAEAMSTTDLIEALCHLDHNHISSLESAIFGEVVFRMKYPVTWRLRKHWSKWSAKYHAWKYCRKRKPKPTTAKGENE
jgi:hypothetical protein